MITYEVAPTRLTLSDQYDVPGEYLWIREISTPDTYVALIPWQEDKDQEARTLATFLALS